jgi:hypothetical protein
MRPDPTGPEPWHVPGAVAASITGLLVHNLAEYPPSIVAAPETLVPLAITVVLGGVLLGRPGRRAFLATAAWAILVGVVGALSVVPLSVWPYSPEQSAGHYAAHAAFALGQLPLLWVAVRGLRADRRPAE